MLKSFIYFLIFLICSFYFYIRWGQETQLSDWQESYAKVLSVSTEKEKVNYLYYRDGNVLRDSIFSIHELELSEYIELLVKHSIIVNNIVVCYYNPNKTNEVVLINKSKSITAWTWIGLVVFIILCFIQIYLIIDKVLDPPKKKKKK